MVGWGNDLVRVNAKNRAWPRVSSLGSWAPHFQFSCILAWLARRSQQGVQGPQPSPPFSLPISTIHTHQPHFHT